VARRVERDAGGIRSLLRFLEEHGEAVEYDCLTHGFRLDEVGVSFSWRDLQTLVTRWGGLPGTALFRSVHGYEGWTTEAQLMAHLIDAIAMLDYHQVKVAGAKSAKKPMPLERPWDKPRSRYGKGAIPFDEIDTWIRSTWK
jgi:hypothetical protein